VRCTPNSEAWLHLVKLNGTVTAIEYDEFHSNSNVNMQMLLNIQGTQNSEHELRISFNMHILHFLSAMSIKCSLGYQHIYN
jgi:hypothetical protein